MWGGGWRGGRPGLSRTGGGVRRQDWGKGFQTGHRLRQGLSWGGVYSFPFDTDEIKKPLVEASLKAGWGWRGVAFSKL